MSSQQEQENKNHHFSSSILLSSTSFVWNFHFNGACFVVNSKNDQCVEISAVQYTLALQVRSISSSMIISLPTEEIW